MQISTKQAQVWLLKRLWAVEHKGLFTQISKRHGCTSKFVSRVYYGEKNSRNGAIERALRRAGAPHVEIPKNKRSQKDDAATAAA